MIKLTKSQWILALGLSGTLAAVALVGAPGDDQGDTAKPAARSDRPRTVAAAGSSGQRRTGTAAVDAASSAGVQPARLIRLLADRRIDDPFSPHSFLPPPPPAPKVAAITVAPPSAPVAPPPPPAPVAPGFPWSFIGRMIDDPQHPQVFLAKNDRLTMVRVGDNIDTNWKLLGMDAKSLRVQFTPLKQVVSVNMAAGSDLTGGGSASNARNNDSNFSLQTLAPPVPVVDVPTSPAVGAPPANPSAQGGVSGIELSTMGSVNNP